MTMILFMHDNIDNAVGEFVGGVIIIIIVVWWFWFLSSDRH